LSAPRFHFPSIALRPAIRYSAAMRPLLIVWLLALAGCATAPNPETMEWSTALAHSDGTPEPVLKDGRLVLSGRAIRSRTAYAAPFTLECELQSAQTSTNGGFCIDFVPEGASTAVLPEEYVGIKLSNDNTLEAWGSGSNQPAHLIKKSGAILLDALGGYKLTVEVRHGGFTVYVNGELMKIDQPVPYDRFQIQLRTFPPPSQWVVRDFSIR
jgi:hypothetical protein